MNYKLEICGLWNNKKCKLVPKSSEHLIFSLLFYVICSLPSTKRFGLYPCSVLDHSLFYLVDCIFNKLLNMLIKLLLMHHWDGIIVMVIRGQRVQVRTLLVRMVRSAIVWTKTIVVATVWMVTFVLSGNLIPWQISCFAHLLHGQIMMESPQAVRLRT